VWCGPLCIPRVGLDSVAWLTALPMVSVCMRVTLPFFSLKLSHQPSRSIGPREVGCVGGETEGKEYLLTLYRFIYTAWPEVISFLLGVYSQQSNMHGKKPSRPLSMPHTIGHSLSLAVHADGAYGQPTKVQPGIYLLSKTKQWLLTERHKLKSTVTDYRTPLTLLPA